VKIGCNKDGLNKTSLEKQIKCNVPTIDSEETFNTIYFMVGINLSFVTKSIKTKY